jgi:hypothetical protein
MKVPPLSELLSTLIYSSAIPSSGFSFKVRSQRSIEFFIIVNPFYPTSGLTVTGLAMVCCIMKSSTKFTDLREVTTEASDCDICCSEGILMKIQPFWDVA